MLTDSLIRIILWVLLWAAIGAHLPFWRVVLVSLAVLMLHKTWNWLER